MKDALPSSTHPMIQLCATKHIVLNHKQCACSLNIPQAVTLKMIGDLIEIKKDERCASFLSTSYNSGVYGEKNRMC